MQYQLYRLHELMKDQRIREITLWMHTDLDVGNVGQLSLQEL